MFPSQNTDELLFHEPSILQQDILDHALFETKASLVSKSNTKKRQRTSKSGNNDEEINIDPNLKKLMHRDIERQRRQEMAGLYASLRSLLPLEYIRGKRSISDHMHEAVNYIQHMEKNIKELRMRRDKLKKKSNSDGSENGSSNSVNVPNCVKVGYCKDGLIEILVNCGTKKENGFPFMSRVLMILLERGLNIVSCVSTKADDQRFLYKIQSEVNDLAYINLPELQQRLANVINLG